MSAPAQDPVVNASSVPFLPMIASGLASGALVWLASRGSGRGATGRPRNDSPPAAIAAGPERDLERLVLEHASDVLMRLDANWRRLFVSPSCRELFGYDAAEVAAAPPLDLVYPDDRDAVRAILADLDQPGAAREAIWRAVHRDGHVLWVEATYRRIAEDGGAVVIMRDITRRKQAEDRLQEARDRLEQTAWIDTLTGLFNRGAFIETAERMLAEGGDMALLFIDLDRFQTINAAHGHAAGDIVLRAVADRLKRGLPRGAIAARMGADEFAVLLRVDDGDSEIAAQARDVIRTVSQPMRHGERTLDTGATIGISVSPRDGHDMTALSRAADLAIAHAKQAGGGAYRFHEPVMTAALEQAALLKQELGAAIHRGEIVPWFQPMMRLEDMNLVGFEIFARWNHPTRGILEPAMFLPLAEEIGASAALFAALLHHACLIARSWPPDISLAVNISPHELHDESLPDDLARILSETDFSGARLEVEITENALIHDSKVARGVMEGLRGLGVSIVLDDFGTGFSSLLHLRDLPFDKIKIDRSFMPALDREAENVRFVGAIVSLAHALGLEVTAEGIEDHAIIERLKALGCTYGQGRAIREPMSAAGLADRFWPQGGTAAEPRGARDQAR